jgi:hypothetical protein
MRVTTTLFLSACTVCAVGQAQHTARADTNQPGQPGPQVPPQTPPQTPPPVPTDTPAGPASNSPGDPTGNSPNSPSTPDNQSPGTGTDQTPVTPDTSPGTTSPAPNIPPPVTDTNPAPMTGSGTGSSGDSGDMGSDDRFSYRWSEPMLQSGIGVSAILGGGVTGFTDKTMRNTTSDIGGLWDLRVTIGSHLPLALDVSYLGSATNINGLPTGDKGTLIGTTVEGALRYNVMPHFAWTPYVFAGAGWQRYDVTQTSVTLSDSGMNSQDNLLEFPLGAGLAYRMNGFVFDLRGTFRATTEADLVLKTPMVTAPTSSDFAPMHTWEASAALGYEF